MLKYILIKDNKYLTIINGVYPFWTDYRKMAYIYSDIEAKELAIKYQAKIEQI